MHINVLFWRVVCWKNMREINYQKIIIQEHYHREFDSIIYIRHIIFLKLLSIHQSIHPYYQFITIINSSINQFLHFSFVSIRSRKDAKGSIDLRRSNIRQ